MALLHLGDSLVSNDPPRPVAPLSIGLLTANLDLSDLRHTQVSDDHSGILTAPGKLLLASRRTDYQGEFAGAGAGEAGLIVAMGTGEDPPGYEPAHPFAVAGTLLRLEIWSI